MTIEAAAQIVIKGSSEALKTLQGIRREVNQAVQDAKKASKEEERAAKAAQKAQQEAARAAQKDAQQTAKTKEKAARDALRAEQKAAADLKRIQDLETRRWQEMAKKAADARIREAERAAARERESAQKARRAWATGIGAVTGGVLAGASSAMNTGRQVAGVKDLRERVAAGNDFERRMSIMATDAGMSDSERSAMEAKIKDISLKTGRDVSDLLGVLEANQAQFNDLRGGLAALETTATISTATGANATEYGIAVGTVKQAFNLTDEQAIEAAYRMRAAAARGAIDPKEFSTAFASKAGTFAQTTKMTGMQGFEQFLGAAQGVGTGQFGGSESATRMEQAVNALANVDVQAELTKIGITGIADSTGKIDVASAIDKLASNSKFAGSAATRQKVFHDLQARQAIEALIAAKQRVDRGIEGAVDLRTISRVTATEGKETTDKAFSKISASSSFKMDQLAAKAQIETIENLEKYNQDILLAAETSVKLESSFGRLALWSDSIAATGAGAFAGGMLGNAAGNMFAKGAGSMMGGLSASAAMGVISSFIVPIVALTATALAAYTATKWATTDKEGDSYLGNLIADLIHGERPERAAGPGLNAPTEKEAEAQRIQKEQLETQKKTQQAIEEIARNRATPMGPPPPPRGPQ